jgi:predicted alpha/beta-fold hydrolase
MANHLLLHHFDILAWNFRGCSGQPNRLPHSYHSGKSEDLRFLVEHVLAQNQYQQIALLGFSVGGNITLKYLGEEGRQVDPRIACAVALSTPCDLASAADATAKWYNIIYMQRFLIFLRKKIRMKASMFPELISTDGLKGVRNFHQFDEAYTAPLNGFSSAREYWQKCSSLRVLSDISIPTVLINALDDSFLGAECHPFEIASNHPYFHFLPTQHGGHVGFIEQGIQDPYWSEAQVVKILVEGLSTHPIAEFS